MAGLYQADILLIHEYQVSFILKTVNFNENHDLPHIRDLCYLRKFPIEWKISLNTSMDATEVNSFYVALFREVNHKKCW